MAKRLRHLKIGTYVPTGAWYHIARVEYRQTRPEIPHTHDFPELFWIEHGQGVHWINGTSSSLSTGDLVFVRPRDQHAFSTPQGMLRLVNVAFAAPLLQDLQQRYGREGLWPWGRDSRPMRYRLTPEQVRRMSLRAERLALESRERQRRLVLDRFLLDVLDEVQPVHPPPLFATFYTLPGWLTLALTKLAEDPRIMEEGVPALVRLCGRSREHVARVLHRLTGRTPTQTVNELRLEWAARTLTMTSKPLLRVAMEAGLPNVSHFYRLFRLRYGTTPRRYRLQQQTILHGV